MKHIALQYLRSDLTAHTLKLLVGLVDVVHITSRVCSYSVIRPCRCKAEHKAEVAVEEIHSKPHILWTTLSVAVEFLVAHCTYRPV